MIGAKFAHRVSGGTAFFILDCDQKWSWGAVHDKGLSVVLNVDTAPALALCRRTSCAPARMTVFRMAVPSATLRLKWANSLSCTMIKHKSAESICPNVACWSLSCFARALEMRSASPETLKRGYMAAPHFHRPMGHGVTNGKMQPVDLVQGDRERAPKAQAPARRPHHLSLADRRSTLTD